MKKGTIILILVMLLPVYALADFSGNYDPSNWTTTCGIGGCAGGTVDTTAAPVAITLIGGDSGCALSGTCTMDYTITAPVAGQVSFDWDYATVDTMGPSYDIFFFLNGAVIAQISDSFGANVQSGSESFTVANGDTFGFRIDPTDGIMGAATVTISNFSGPTDDIPTLSEWGMIILSLLMAGTAFWFIRRQTVVA